MSYQQKYLKAKQLFWIWTSVWIVIVCSLIGITLCQALKIAEYKQALIGLLKISLNI